ncbi:molybdopterin converting factor subunit 1 [Chitinophaga nivalis]|uniref:Molybdopterin converting factor subunit 1 n=1 Tax=Chitinophaga nivalis TaxID=2991709 RepID=A0ABT3IU01_9BACT|nr:molybdopterin converting factor subunit 1 [Chitinophaga nivalis]MCW3462886.1 molybdopterin converting factor subunit 1 [Chitinophaga nivalis]MCW3487424.1 molybdopterin converting factor subunit 1 [Chitinophaga nivalis]
MHVLLFGVVKDTAGVPVLTVPEELQDVAALKAWLYATYPSLQQLKSLMIAINSTYATDDQLLDATAEIAVIPPVSGG